MSNCSHQFNRHVHPATRVDLSLTSCYRDEVCLQCNDLLTVNYENGKETSAVSKVSTPIEEAPVVATESIAPSGEESCSILE